MRLSQKELRRLRLLRRHLKEIIADSNAATIREEVVSNRVARRHLAWINKTLLEEHPDHDLLLDNMRELESDVKPVTRVTNDILEGE